MESVQYKNHWEFANLDSTPSLKNGMTKEQEWKSRLLGCTLIKFLGIQVGFSTFTIYYACVLFQRYFMLKSLKACKYQEIAVTCLSLSAKINYQAKYDLKSLIRAFESIENSDVDRLAYENWKKTIIYYEEYILRTLYFDMEILDPFKYSFDKFSRFNSLLPKQDHLPHTFIQLVFALLSDSALSPDCVLFNTKEWIGAAWLIALHQHGSLLEHDVTQKIMNSIKKDAHLQDVTSAMDSLLEFYKQKNNSMEEIEKKVPTI